MNEILALAQRMQEIERLTGLYNAAVANGHIIKAQRLDRIIKHLKGGAF